MTCAVGQGPPQSMTVCCGSGGSGGSGGNARKLVIRMRNEAHPHSPHGDGKRVDRFVTIHTLYILYLYTTTRPSSSRRSRRGSACRWPAPASSTKPRHLGGPPIAPSGRREWTLAVPTCASAASRAQHRACGPGVPSGTCRPQHRTASACLTRCAVSFPSSRGTSTVVPGPEHARQQQVRAAPARRTRGTELVNCGGQCGRHRQAGEGEAAANECVPHRAAAARGLSRRWTTGWA